MDFIGLLSLADMRKIIGNIVRIDLVWFGHLNIIKIQRTKKKTLDIIYTALKNVRKTKLNLPRCIDFMNMYHI